MANAHLVMEYVVFVSVLILISNFCSLNKAIKMVSRYLGPKGEYLLSSSEKISVFKRERA